MRKPVDLTGRRFGRLTVIKKGTPSKSPKGTVYSRWLCQCDCGKHTTVLYSNLQTGTSKSCGCLRKDIMHVIKTKSIEDVLHRQIMSYYERNAKMRKLCWELNKETFIKLIHEPCYYCGVVGGTETKYSNPTQRTILGQTTTIRNNGIDRLDNKLGYTTDNSVTCCKRCNQSKNNMTYSEFITWLKRAYEFQHKKGVI